MFMAIKTITVTVEAYNAIKGMKKEEESFSELFLRLRGRGITIKELSGLLKNSDIEQEFWERRKKLGKHMEKRLNDLRS